MSEDFRGPAAFGSDWEQWLIYAWHRVQDHVDLTAMTRVCPETEEELYGEGSPARTLRYTQGQRPMLEMWLAGLSHSEKRLLESAEGKIVDALLSWVHWEVLRRGEVIRQDKWSKQLIGGGTEEEILAFIGRTGTYECARLLATLLQVKGIPARLLFVFQSEFRARTCVEAWFEGRWHVCDIADASRYAGGVELLNDPPETFAAALLGVVNYPARNALTLEFSAGFPVADDRGGAFDAESALADRLKMAEEGVADADGLAPFVGWSRRHGEAAPTSEFSANEPPMAEEVIMCAETAEYLYRDFTPTTVVYNAGDRPVLEGLLATCVLRGKPRPVDDQELVFAVFDWVFYQTLFRYLAVFPVVHRPRFRYLGTDEDVANFRSRCDCYCASRLAASMLQTAGIPTRLVYMLNAKDRGGHTCFEAHVDGAWRFWDVSCHDYALNRDGSVASIWEIMSDEYCRGEGLRKDTVKPTPILRLEYLANLGIGNYPIADSTAHYNQPDGSFWFAEGSLDARRTARFGI